MRRPLKSKYRVVGAAAAARREESKVRLRAARHPEPAGTADGREDIEHVNMPAAAVEPRRGRKGAEVRRILIAGFVAALVLGTASTSSAFPKKGEVFTITCGDASVTTHWTPVGMGADVAWGQDGAIYHLKSFDIRIYRGEFTTEPEAIASLEIYGDREGQPIIAMLELASGRLLKAECKPGQLSVGVVVNVTHTAATPVGAWVEAESTFTGRDGKLYVFEVVARDPGGEVMRGVHKRAVIDESRLLEGARKRGA